MPTEHKRSARVTGRVRQELATLLQRQISDPRVVGVIITRVEMPDDLQSAKVYVRLETGGDDPGARRTLLRGLSAAAGKLRYDLGQVLSLRRAPELRFFYDERLDDVMRIEGLLNEIAIERKGDE